MLVPATAVLRAVQAAVFAVALMLGGLVTGGWPRVATDHPAAIDIDARDLNSHDHRHDHEGSDGSADSGETGANADHGGTHHHVDANAVSPAAFVRPNGTPMRARLAEPATITWAVPPPQRPPPVLLSTV